MALGPVRVCVSRRPAAAALVTDAAVARGPERQKELAQRHARASPGHAEVFQELVQVVREQRPDEVALAPARHHLRGPAMHAADLPLHLLDAREPQRAPEAYRQPARGDLGAQLAGDREVPADEAEAGDVRRYDEAGEVIATVTFHQTPQVLVEEPDVADLTRCTQTCERRPRARREHPRPRRRAS